MTNNTLLTKLQLYITLSYKLLIKLLLLDKDIPILLKINNIFLLLLAPLFFIYELLAQIIPLPFSEIITLYSFAIIYLSWTVSISLIGLVYYTIIRYHITNNEQHIATIENAIGDPFHIYTTNNTKTATNLQSNTFNNPHTLSETEYENTYILLNTALTPPPLPRYTYDNLFLFNIYCYIGGINLVTEEDIIQYIRKNYPDEEIPTLFHTNDNEDNELQTAINSDLLVENI